MSNHLQQVNMTYFSHLKRAWRIGSKMMYNGLLYIIHGVYPNVFETSASKCIDQLHIEIHTE